LPGSFLLLILGFLAPIFKYNVLHVLLVAIVASILGDTCGYILGRMGLLKNFLSGNNFIKKHYSCKEASKEMMCIEENIRRVCVGKSKTAKGFIWKYE
jgi:membrane protein DedA with SNARE-associated domain